MVHIRLRYGYPPALGEGRTQQKKRAGCPARLEVSTDKDQLFIDLDFDYSAIVVRIENDAIVTIAA